MGRLIFNRAWQGILMLLTLSLVVFILTRMSGSPAALLLPPDATADDVTALEELLGLNEPLPIQYAKFIGAAATGNLGNSLRSRRPVVDMIFERFPASFQVMGLGVFIMLLGIPFGMLSALRRGGISDLAIRLLASFGQAMPSFWLGTTLALVIGVWARLLPVAGRSGWESALLPAIAMSMYALSGITRLTRSGMLEVMGQDYILYARAKGMPNRTVILKHGLRNALIPVVSFASIVIVTHFILGSVVVETVFAWPGVGYLAYQSVINRDYPVLQGVVLMMGAVFVVTNLVVDIGYGYLNPRLRPK